VPAFHPVPVGTRRDGWTVERQARFIGMLVETRSVAAAARAVGMGRESAYRLRKRPGAAGFAAAWDAALGKERESVRAHLAKSTGLSAAERARTGRVRLLMHAGRYRGFVLIPDHCALMQQLTQFYRARRQAEPRKRRRTPLSGSSRSTCAVPCMANEPRGPAPFKQAGAASRSA